MSLKIKNCRSCKSNRLQNIYSLGKQTLTGIFPPNIKTKVTQGSLNIIICLNCKLMQLDKNFDSNEMYGDNYGYMSSLNKSMISHLHLKFLNLKNKYSLKSGDNILDIGSNDGTFLSFFNKKFKLYGCDPTIKKFKKHYRNDIIKIPKFFSADLFNKTKFKLITSISMFYDLPDPLKFAIEVYSILRNNGIWHIELSYMPMMIKNGSYDTICHEHLEYYSLRSIKHLLDRAKLKIINLSFNQINGGSIALDISKKNSKYKECKYLINWVLKSERFNSYNDIKKHKEFFQNCKNHRILLKKLLSSLKSQNKKIIGYGASTKGNVLLQFCKINSKLVDCIAEVNKFKFNKFTPGSKIKIVSEKRAKLKKPDYMLVLPWHFKDHIIKREQKYLKNGGKLIFPLPEIEII
ncbi:MAG: methyltransferase [Candidatus Pelagibacter sp.]|nr:methyltransferase [Candidatus Pelagibacter sp.]|tara:strand:- start:2541 stop:3758 length:1218 start_codon:yes stop_codon:yes gene_type:complete